MYPNRTIYGGSGNTGFSYTQPDLSPVPYDPQFAFNQLGMYGANANMGGGTGKGFFAGAKDKMSGLFSKARNYANNNFGYSFSGNPNGKWNMGTVASTPNANGTSTNHAGLNAFGIPLGYYANIASGIAQGAQAIGGLSQNSEYQDDNEDVINKILTSAGSNPITSSYLTSDQLTLLNKLKMGSEDSEASFGDYMGNINITDGLQGALMGAVGGLPGVLIGGLGGIANGAIDRTGEELQGDNSELLALYQALIDAESQYKAMKRPNFNGLGIQQQYQNMYM